MGRFEILGELGRGGFGVVYQARDRELSRTVAFKAIRAGGSDGHLEALALAEAEAAARLAHPNIVQLYDLGRCERGAYLILELLRGETLDVRLVKGALPLREAVRVAVELSRGLTHAHRQGVVHRDLKPSNVFLCEDGQVKVLDFGLAAVLGKDGLSGGTPAYASPEQARRERGDERSDVYSLGVILVELLTGQRPAPPPKEPDPERRVDSAPAASGPIERSEAVVHPAGAPLPVLPGAPASLSKLVARMLAPDPAARPAGGAEAHQELAAIQRSLEPRRLARTAWAVAMVALLGAAWLVLERRPPLPAGRLLVAMADTANTTGDADLDGLSSLLGTALEQSKRVSLIARSRLLGILHRAPGRIPERIDEGLARGAAREVRASALIVPAVRRSGDGYDLEVRAVDLARDQPIFTVRERAAGKGAVPDALDRLTAHVRAELQEDPKDAPPEDVRLARVVPVNPEAWRRYAEGQRLESEARQEEARRAYERTLELDPDFPLAHVQLAQMDWLRDQEATRAHLTAALANLDRVPLKDRELIEARRAIIEIRLTDAVAHYDKVIAGWPQDPAAYVEAGSLLLTFYGGVAMARPYLEKAVELSPLTEHQAIDFLEALGRTEEALARASRWTEEAPSLLAFHNLSFVHRVRGERAEALAATRRALALGAPPTIGVLWAFLEAGAEDEAEQWFQRPGGPPWEWVALRGQRRAALAAFDAETSNGRTSARGLHHVRRADFLWGDGDADRVWREVVAALDLGAKAVNCVRANMAHLGDLERAARLHELWPADDPRGFCASHYLLIKAWKTGDREGALRGFADMYLRVGKYHRGEILQELGRDREAVEQFRLFRRVPIQGFAEAETWMYPRSLVFEAASLERLGERAEALQVVDRLLHLWKRADPDLPDLLEAKALRARLTPRGP